MIHLTNNEKKVLIFLALVLVCGSIANYLFKKYPFLPDIVNLIDSERIYHKIDINTATKEEIQRIPFIGDYTATQIIRYRELHGLYHSIDQLRKVTGIREDNFKRFAPYLKVGLHGP